MDDTGLQYSPFFTTTFTSPGILPGLLNHSPGAFMTSPSPLAHLTSPSPLAHLAVSGGPSHTFYNTSVSPLQQALFVSPHSNEVFGQQPHSGFVVHGGMFYSSPAPVQLRPAAWQGRSEDLVDMIDGDYSFDSEDPLVPRPSSWGLRAGRGRGKGKGRGRGRGRGRGKARSGKTRRNQKKVTVSLAEGGDCPSDSEILNMKQSPQPSSLSLYKSLSSWSPPAIVDQDSMSRECAPAIQLQQNGETGLSFEELMMEQKPFKSQKDDSVTSQATVHLSSRNSGAKSPFSTPDVRSTGVKMENVTPSLKDLLGIADEQMRLDILSEIEVTMEPEELHTVHNMGFTDDQPVISL